MANRRMFSMKIVDTDAFLDMPQSSQLLYFHLAMRADDDGFVANPKKVMRMIGAQDDDYKVLLAKRFILVFDSGVCVIKHWLIHNLIRQDRYTETQWIKEKQMLVIDEKTKKYSLNNGNINVIPNGNQLAPQVRLGKVRLGKVNTRSELELIQKIIHHFFSLKEWKYDGSKKSQVVFARYLKSAKDLLYLCDGELEEAKECLNKLGKWAKSRELDWSIETVFKKWYELDLLKEKEKKPYLDGNRVFKIGPRWYVLEPNGDKLLYEGSENKFLWK